MDINGISAIVTGGSSGLGRAAATRLATAGARVAVLDVADSVGREFAAEIGGIYVPLDVSDTASIVGALATAEAVHGVARVLVNCAGITQVAKVVDDDGSPMPSRVIRSQIDINLVGTIEMMSRFAARLVTVGPIEDERGVVVNVASIAAYEGSGGQVAYAASKGGVVSVTLPAARDLAPHGIRVMAIAPGIYRTNMLSMLDEESLVLLGRQVPFPKRLGDPDEFGQLVQCIVTNPMLNGSVIRIDGAHRLPA